MALLIVNLDKMIGNAQQWRDELTELNGAELATVPRYNLMVPRSACPACAHPISALENVPLLSYLVLRGKCKACHTGISPRYPFVEALTAAFLQPIGGMWIAPCPAVCPGPENCRKMRATGHGDLRSKSMCMYRELSVLYRSSSLGSKLLC